jgi:hypothetical protein
VAGAGVRGTRADWRGSRRSRLASGGGLAGGVVPCGMAAGWRLLGFARIARWRAGRAGGGFGVRRWIGEVHGTRAGWRGSRRSRLAVGGGMAGRITPCGMAAVGVCTNHAQGVQAGFLACEGGLAGAVYIAVLIVSTD